MTSSTLERILLATAAVALTLGLASAAQAKPSTPSHEIPVTSRIDHVVVYEQGAQVERVAEVALNEGIQMLVFGGLHTGIDPSRIRLTGKGRLTGKQEFNLEYTFTVVNRKQADVTLQVEDQLPLVRTEEISIDRLKLDGAHVHEASGKVVWDLEVKAGEQVERKLKYVIQSPRELMVLAD